MKWERAVAFLPPPPPALRDPSCNCYFILLDVASMPSIVSCDLGKLYLCIARVRDLGELQRSDLDLDIITIELRRFVFKPTTTLLDRSSFAIVHSVRSEFS
jgi:hypothetical protein